MEIVHQIPYNKSKAKYPAETIVENSGDCDGLSLVAASIMKAGDLDVVLFIYPTYPVSHMNIGVHLSHEPIYHTRGIEPTNYEYNGKKYYTAETTSGTDWKVGDQPKCYRSIEPCIISLENCETASPGEVSSSLGSPLIPSSISLSLIPETSNASEEGNTIKISGSILPVYAEQQVTIYINHQESSRHDVFMTVTTDHLGNYSLTWNFNTTGTYTIQSSWNGVHNYAGSDSEKLTVHVGLNQLLDQYEVVNSWWVGSEVIQTTALSKAGACILSNYGVIEFLEKNFTETGVLLSSEFIILGNEEDISRSEQIITIPEQTTVIPSYEEKMDNHLEFMLRRNGHNNYSASVRLLDDSDISQISNKSGPMFVNASEYVRENTWYNLETKISEDLIIANLFEENITHLSETVPISNNTGICEFRILMKYDPDSLIVFKSLEAEIPDQPTQLVEGNNPNILELLAPHIGMYLFELAIILAVAIPILICARKRRKLDACRT
ncbi:MAG: Ig-like domain repeat protein [Candidatus Bathyarchaeum sp.]|nr:MAG: Ig-like domain repeat protein [Candidatus Bathyarchaeum sp.]